MSDRLRSRVAVLTGASKGLGKAMALALAAEGARVALVSRAQEQLETLAAKIQSNGGTAEAFPADVTNEEDIERVSRGVVARFGQVNILINNAGINVRKSIGESTLDDWHRVMDTNVTSAFLMCRNLLPYMRGRGYGRIINMTSIMSHVSMANRVAYSASKAALLGMTRSLALELAPEAITVNGISPGPFISEMTRPLMEDASLNAQMLSNIPLGRWGKPEEVGQLAVYLCSDEAAFVTGTDILIDGGWTAR
jgi:NAD(P)-dependent dehydrogenase (short-subunit alcohol dehydrogenase family)